MQENNINNLNTNEETVEEKNENTKKNNEENLEQKIEELQKKLLLEMAELENMRKRSEKQIKDASDYAISSFARDLMSVMDNLEKALEHQNISDNSGDNSTQKTEIKNLIIGVEMTKNELNNVFSKYGLVKISPNLGDKFDYESHQAISYEESDKFEANTISNIMQSGYKLKDRLLRPAMVVVSKGKQA